MEKLKKQKFKRRGGITLIALVVTIIVMLILAAISIIMLTGDNSILKRAVDAKENTEKSQIEERIKLAYHSALTEGKGSYTKESLEEELEKEFENDYSVDDSDNSNWILTAKGQSVTIPAGIKIKVAILQGKEFWQGGNLVKVGSSNTNITAIIHSSIKPSESIIDDPNHLWSTTNSECPVLFWIDGNILKYWTEARKILLPKDCSDMFCGWNNLKDISGLKDFDASEIENMERMFCQISVLNLNSIKDWNTSNVKNMSQVFANCDSLTSVTEINNWDVSNVENMFIMFAQCHNITDIDISKWDTQNVTNMQEMFQGSNKLTKIYVSDKFKVDNVTNSVKMFGACTSLIGGNGTTFDSTKIDKTYAHIDGGTSNPGYFTSK